MSDWRLDWEDEDCWLDEDEDPDPGRMTVKLEDWGLDEDVEENPEEDPEEVADWEENDEVPEEVPDAAVALIATKFS